jgi:hypothetical protein
VVETWTWTSFLRSGCVAAVAYIARRAGGCVARSLAHTLARSLTRSLGRGRQGMVTGGSRGQRGRWARVSGPRQTGGAASNGPGRGRFRAVAMWARGLLGLGPGGRQAHVGGMRWGPAGSGLTRVVTRQVWLARLQALGHEPMTMHACVKHGPMHACHALPTDTG